MQIKKFLRFIKETKSKSIYSSKKKNVTAFYEWSTAMRVVLKNRFQTFKKKPKFFFLMVTKCTKIIIFSLKPLLIFMEYSAVAIND